MGGVERTDVNRLRFAVRLQAVSLRSCRTASVSGLERAAGFPRLRRLAHRRGAVALQLAMADSGTAVWEHTAATSRRSPGIALVDLKLALAFP